MGPKETRGEGAHKLDPGFFLYVHSYSSQPCFFHVFRIAEGRTSESMAYIFQSSFTLSGSGNCDTKRELNADDGLVFVKADVQKP